MTRNVNKPAPVKSDETDPGAWVETVTVEGPAKPAPTEQTVNKYLTALAPAANKKSARRAPSKLAACLVGGAAYLNAKWVREGARVDELPDSAETIDYVRTTNVEAMRVEVRGMSDRLGRVAKAKTGPDALTDENIEVTKNGAGDVTVSYSVRGDDGRGSARVSITYKKGDALADMLANGADLDR